MKYLIYLLVGVVLDSCDRGKIASDWDEETIANVKAAFALEAMDLSLNSYEKSDYCDCMLNRTMTQYPMSKLKSPDYSSTHFLEQAKYMCFIDIGVDNRFQNFMYNIELKTFKRSVETIESVTYHVDEFWHLRDENPIWWAYVLNQFRYVVIDGERLTHRFYAIHSAELKTMFKNNLLEGAKLIYNDSLSTNLNPEGIKLVNEWKTYWIEYPIKLEPKKEETE